MRSIKILNYLILSFLLTGMIACGSGADQPADNESGDMTETAPAAASVSLSDFSASPDYPDASLALTGYENGTFSFEVANYELGAQTSDAPQKMCANSGKGQHIHLIVDDNPYAAKYTASFEHEVADGDHYLLAFLSRSYHESIKTDDAHIAVTAPFSGGKMGASDPIEGPMLFYSRPKGTYVGKAETDKVMLDFYLVNTTLAADGNKVTVEVNGETTFTVDEWKPYFIEGLPMGDNRIKLTLIDKEGNPVDAPLNPVERVFTLKEDPAE